MDTIKAKLTSHFWQPDRKFWRIEGRRGDWHVQFPFGDDIIVYHQIKYGTASSLSYGPQSRLYFGKVVGRTDDTIEFVKKTKKELGIKSV